MLDAAGVTVRPVAGAKAAASSSDSPLERGYERGERVGDFVGRFWQLAGCVLALTNLLCLDFEV